MNKYIKTQEEYFNDWDMENLDKVDNSSDISREEIYQKYVIRKKVFERDSFKCKNEECKAPHSKLTMHHIKHLRNSGKTSMKNCITVCDSCHRAFNRFKKDLLLNGITYRLHKIEEVNMKLLVQTGKNIRKENKEFHGYIFSWEWLCVLLDFISKDYRDIKSVSS